MFKTLLKFFYEYLSSVLNGLISIKLNEQD